MSGLNQSGPTGQGPMTGRKMGRCTNFGAKSKDECAVESTKTEIPVSEPQNLKTRGLGRKMDGTGRGMGRRNRFRGGASDTL